MYLKKFFEFVNTYVSVDVATYVKSLIKRIENANYAKIYIDNTYDVAVQFNTIKKINDPEYNTIYFREVGRKKIEIFFRWKPDTRDRRKVEDMIEKITGKRHIIDYFTKDTKDILLKWEFEINKENESKVITLINNIVDSISSNYGINP